MFSTLLEKLKLHINEADYNQGIIYFLFCKANTKGLKKSLTKNHKLK